MQYFYIEPEVSGGLGEHTIIDRSVHPPIVSKLHYQMEGWLGDAILETFPAFIVTAEAKEGLVASEVTGATFTEVEITKTQDFTELYPNRKLPPFSWLKPASEAGQADFGTAPDGRLVVSERALDVLRKFGVENALIEPFGD